MLLIGTEKMGKLVIKHLASKGCRQVVVVNRSVEKVDVIRGEMKVIEIVYNPLDEMMSATAEANVIFTSTASKTPLFLKEHVEALSLVSKEIGVRLFVDIYVLRHIVSNVEYVRVYNMDDLKEVVEANKEDMLRTMIKAQELITKELKKFEAWRIEIIRC